MDKQKCFIIMPITTPPEIVEKYGNDINHFEHVLNYLFIPSIEKAGLDPIPPVRKASENIQAEIIKYLDTTELVLCDISTLNPNVFFELGCRTALNKPVCYVRDNLTGKIPFDNGTIVHGDYDSKLDPWIVEKEIPKLAAHLTDSIKNSAGQNTLWKYFGLKTIAKPIDFTNNANTGNELALMKITELNSRLEAIGKDGYTNTPLTVGPIDDKFVQKMLNLTTSIMAEYGSPLVDFDYESRSEMFTITVNQNKISTEARSFVADLYVKRGLNYRILDGEAKQ
jgi:hypothetical protein